MVCGRFSRRAGKINTDGFWMAFAYGFVFGWFLDVGECANWGLTELGLGFQFFHFCFVYRSRSIGATFDAMCDATPPSGQRSRETVGG